MMTVARTPTDKERTGIVKLLAGAKDPAEKRLALEDVFWGLMSSREFIFNH